MRKERERGEIKSFGILKFLSHYYGFPYNTDSLIVEGVQGIH